MAKSQNCDNCLKVRQYSFKKRSDVGLYFVKRGPFGCHILCQEIISHLESTLFLLDKAMLYTSGT